MDEMRRVRGGKCGRGGKVERMRRITARKHCGGKEVMGSHNRIE